MVEENIEQTQYEGYNPELLEMQRWASSPVQQETQGLHKFLKMVVDTPDTTKLGYLKEEEIGLPKYPLRTSKNLALISKAIMDNDYFSSYFNAEGEIITSTSLSRNAKLLNLSVISRKQVEDVTKTKKKPNKGWFKKKEKEEEELT